MFRYYLVSHSSFGGIHFHKMHLLENLCWLMVIGINFIFSSPAIKCSDIFILSCAGKDTYLPGFIFPIHMKGKYMEMTFSLAS